MLAYLQSLILPHSQSLSSSQKTLIHVLPFIISYLPIGEIRVNAFHVCKKWREVIRTELSTNLMTPEAEINAPNSKVPFRDAVQLLFEQMERPCAQWFMEYQRRVAMKRGLTNTRLEGLPRIGSISPTSSRSTTPPLTEQPQSLLTQNHINTIFLWRELTALRSLKIDFPLSLELMKDLDIFQRLQKVKTLKIVSGAHLTLRTMFQLFKRVEITDLDITEGEFEWDDQSRNKGRSIEMLPFVGLNEIKCGQWWDNDSVCWYQDANMVRFVSVLLRQRSMRVIHILDFPQVAFKNLLAEELANQPFCEEMTIKITRDEVYDHQRMLLASNPDSANTLVLNTETDATQDYVPSLRTLSNAFQDSNTVNLKRFHLELAMGQITPSLVDFLESLDNLTRLLVKTGEAQHAHDSPLLNPLPLLASITLVNCFHLLSLAPDELNYLFLSLNIDGRTGTFDVNAVTRFYCIQQLNVKLTDESPRRWSSESLKRGTYSEAMFMVENFLLSNPVSCFSLMVSEDILAGHCTFFESLHDCADLEELSIDVLPSTNFTTQDSMRIEFNLRGIMPNVTFFSIDYQHVSVQQLAWFAFLLPRAEEFLFSNHEVTDEELELVLQERRSYRLFSSFQEFRQKYPDMACHELFEQFLRELLMELQLAVRSDEYEEIETLLNEEVFAIIEENGEGTSFLYLPPGYSMLYVVFSVYYQMDVAGGTGGEVRTTISPRDTGRLEEQPDHWSLEEMWEVLEEEDFGRR